MDYEYEYDPRNARVACGMRRSGRGHRHQTNTLVETPPRYETCKKPVIVTGSHLYWRPSPGTSEDPGDGSVGQRSMPTAVGSTLNRTTAVKLSAAGSERDTRRICPIDYLELTPKQVRECTEIYMGDIGLEKIRGFEKLKNIECLWLNNNKLQYINNLDNNFRIKVLYAQHNQICSLKGSMNCMRFLDTLDLSHNNLRDLEKLLTYLEKFNFLHILNLKGNPCCEEPDYRLHVISKVPSVHILDQHIVTEQERFDARTQIGGDISALTIAFGKRIPMPDPWAMEKVNERTQTEQECNAEAETLRNQRARATQDADYRLYEKDPHPPMPADQPAPPPPGWSSPQKALAAAATKPAASPAKREKPEYVPKDTFHLVTIAKGELDTEGTEIDDMGAMADAKITLNSHRLSQHLRNQAEARRPTVIKRTQYRM